MIKAWHVVVFALGMAWGVVDASAFPAPCRYQGVMGMSTQNEFSASGVLLEPSAMGPLYTHYAFAGRVGNSLARGLIGRLSHFGSVQFANNYYDQASLPGGTLNGFEDVERRGNRLIAVGYSAFNANNFGGTDHFALLTTEWGDVITSAVYGASTTFEVASCVSTTADGGYIIAGTARENTAQSYEQSTQHIAVIKVDANLDLQWHRRYRVQLKGFVEDIIQLSDGSYVLAGATEANLAASSRDALVMRIGNTGNPIWARRFGNPVSGLDHAYAVRQVSPTQLVVVGAGTALGAGYGAEDLYVVRVGVNGTVGTQLLAGWSGDDRGVAFEAASNGTLRIGGMSRGPNANPGTPTKYWQLELTPANGVYWSRLYAAPTNSALNYDFDMLPQGSAWLTGVQGTGPGSPYFQLFTIRTDPIGLINSVNGGCQVYQIPALALMTNPVASVTVSASSISGVKRPFMRAEKYDLPSTSDCVDCSQCPLEQAANRIGAPSLADDYEAFRLSRLGDGTGPALVEDYYELAAAVNAVLARDEALLAALGEFVLLFSDSVVLAAAGKDPVSVSEALLRDGIALGRKVAVQLGKAEAVTVESWISAVERDPVGFARGLGIAIKLVP